MILYHYTCRIGELPTFDVDGFTEVYSEDGFHTPNSEELQVKRAQLAGNATLPPIPEERYYRGYIAHWSENEHPMLGFIGYKLH